MTKLTKLLTPAALLTQIASKHLCMATLETRDRGDLDFREVGVWNVKAALEAAYQAGRQSAAAK
jgi:hypothetical protein